MINIETDISETIVPNTTVENTEPIIMDNVIEIEDSNQPDTVNNIMTPIRSPRSSPILNYKHTRSGGSSISKRRNTFLDSSDDDDDILFQNALESTSLTNPESIFEEDNVHPISSGVESMSTISRSVVSKKTNKGMLL